MALNDPDAEMTRWMRSFDKKDRRREQQIRAEEAERALTPFITVREARLIGQPFFSEFQNDADDLGGGSPPSSTNPTPRFAAVGLYQRASQGSDNATDHTSPSDAYGAAAVVVLGGGGTHVDLNYYNLGKYPHDGTDLSVPLDFGLRPQIVYEGKTFGPMHDQDGYSAVAAQITDYHFRAASSTGYIKLYWDAVIRNNVGGAVVSTSSKTYTIGPEAPFGTSDPGDYSTYQSTALNAISTTTLRSADPSSSIPGDQKNTVAYIENFRWSAVSGYVPPVDGSANGFPPAP